MAWDIVAREESQSASNTIPDDDDYSALGTLPPDSYALPKTIDGREVKGVELMLFIKTGAGANVAASTLRIGLQLLDVDADDGAVVTSVVEDVAPRVRVGFDATPGPRRIFPRVASVTGTAGASTIESWGFKLRPLF